MANTVFRVTPDNKVVVHPEAVKLSPVLGVLNDKQLRYVILVYDYVKSPFRMRAETDRKRLVKRMIYGKDTAIEPEKNEKVKKAIKEYRQLIYEPKRETLDVIKQKLKNVNEQILKVDESKTDIKRIQELDKVAQYFQDRYDSLEQEIESEEESMTVRGDYKLSFLEEWQMNQMKKIKNNRDED
jgi:hypothetical protein